MTRDADHAVARAEPSSIVMLVGNTDVLIFGYGGNKGKNEDLLDNVLATRSMKKPNAATGALKDRLAKVPDKAVALMVGEIPDDMKRGSSLCSIRSLQRDRVHRTRAARLGRASRIVDGQRRGCRQAGAKDR